MYFKDGAILPASGYLESGDRAVFVFDKNLGVVDSRTVCEELLNMLDDNYDYCDTEIKLEYCTELLRALVEDYISPALRIDCNECLNPKLRVALVSALDRLLFEFWQVGYCLDPIDFVVKYNYLITSELADMYKTSDVTLYELFEGLNEKFFNFFHIFLKEHTVSDTKFYSFRVTTDIAENPEAIREFTEAVKELGYINSEYKLTEKEDNFESYLVFISEDDTVNLKEYI